MHNPILDTVISERDNLNVISIPDMLEIKSALFSIESTKIPGPNGFGAGFFKQYWEVVKHDFF